MYAVPLLIEPMEAAADDRILAGHMIAVVGKLLPGFEPRGFSHDFVTLHHEVAAVGVGEDPLAPKEGDRAVGAVVDRHKINKGMRFVRREAAAAMMVAELVEPGGQAGEFGRTGHAAHKGEILPGRKRGEKTGF